MNNPSETPESKPLNVKDLHVENPRWCVGCGDFGILMGVKRFMVARQLEPEKTVNISGIGCSGRAPNYINTYGVHTIHGRPITVALGLALTRPDLHLFIHSGDGDALSIGGNHLIHGINKNFNCVFLMYDNEIYALTKSQTSPTTRRGHKTNTQPSGTFLDPLNAMRLALGAGASFVASTADWMPQHLAACLNKGFDHKGFSFIHISQRCPHFDPTNFDYKNPSWFGFLQHPEGIPPDKRLAGQAEIVSHDPDDLMRAFDLVNQGKIYFGLIYQNIHKPCYDDIQRNLLSQDPPPDRKHLLDRFIIDT